MNVGNDPRAVIKNFKRTRIVATVGPATNSYDMVESVIRAGANGIRLNFSHGSHEERDLQIAWVRKASKVANKPVAIIQDLQGPKIRLGDFDGIVNVTTGQNIVFGYKADYENTGIIPTQYDLSLKVKRGETLYLYDGKIKTTITSVRDGLVHTKAENDGILIKRKGINVPDTDFGGDIITKKDRTDIAYGSTAGVDYVALSFVQVAGDIKKLRRILDGLGSSAKIIAKIETKLAVDNLEDIVKECDAVMVARGDLAIETSPESVPIIQRQIIELGMKYAKPTIVATQMLASMTESPEPTRAEVSDVATAVLVGADSIMLSDETANGKYPLEAVKVMHRVIDYTQSHKLHPTAIIDINETEKTKSRAIARSVINLAEAMGATAIVAETKSGATALNIAACRPERPILAVTSSDLTAQQLAIVYGVRSYIRPDSKLQATNLMKWLHKNNALKAGDVVITASGKYPGVVGSTDTIKVRVI